MTVEEFLSTPSARRATVQHLVRQPHPLHFYPRPPRGGRLSRSGIHNRFVRNFYPRPPRGGRPRTTAHHCKQRFISIHALREEGDCVPYRDLIIAQKFLSTPSARRATFRFLVITGQIAISIHALREEGDQRVTLCSAVSILFLSTPSARRATNKQRSVSHDQRHFYPRPPRGGRPPNGAGGAQGNEISIHALREEGDAVTP